MCLVNRVSIRILPLLVIEKTVSVAQTKFGLLQGNIERNCRRNLKTKTALLITAHRVIVIIKPTQRPRHVPILWRKRIRRCRKNSFKSSGANRRQPGRDKYLFHKKNFITYLDF